MKRSLHDVAQSAIEQLNAGTNPLEVCSYLKDKTEQAADRESNTELLDGKTAFNEFINYRERLRNGKVAPPLKTGFSDIDAILGGFVNKGFYILAARPGIGKTTMAVNIAENISKHVPVLFVSLEMDGLQVTAPEGCR